MGRRGLISVGAVLAVAVLGVAALVLPRLHTRDAEIEGYRNGPGDRQIILVSPDARLRAPTRGPARSADGVLRH